MKKLKSFRARHQLTQRDIFAALGYKLRIWQKYETGERVVPAHVLISIANYELIHIQGLSPSEITINN